MAKRHDENDSSDPLALSRSHTLATSGIRLDKWLWFARFFKSRSQATDAVSGGLVHVSGERVKPARVIHIGDTLAITRGTTQFEVVVRSIPGRRGPAVEAQTAYAETQASVANRERQR